MVSVTLFIKHLDKTLKKCYNDSIGVVLHYQLRTRRKIMEQKIIEIIAEYQDRDVSEYTADQTFVEMGLDSLDLAELILQLEDSTDAEIDISPAYNTPAKLAKYIESKM
jgi:acyl carrier protein